MKINVIYIPDTKVWRDAYKQYTVSYPDGFPVKVRRTWHCNDCKVEVGGYFGNKVYGNIKSGLCKTCEGKQDSNVQRCLQTTGMTPSAYQSRRKVAWNE